MLIDSHCHLYMGSWGKNLDEVLTRAKDNGVEKFICPGINLQTSRQAIEIANTHLNVFAAAGIHPHDADDASTNYLTELREILSDRKIVALGEIGMDFYRNYSDADTQRKIFIEQLELAQELDLPVIIHNRSADTEVLEIIQAFAPIKGVAHCFSSDLSTANKLIDFGLYISFAGNLTYKNSNLPEVAKELPLNKILIETDAPFLSPVPLRGKENEPANVRIVAEKLMDIRGVSFNTIENETTNNAELLFNL